MRRPPTAGDEWRRTGGSHSGRWAAAATTLLAAVIDLIIGSEASLVVPLVFGPFVASALASVRDTVVLAAVATGLAMVLGGAGGDASSSAHVVRVVSVASGGCLAIWLAVQRVQRESKLQAVTVVAEVAQDAILHPLPPHIGGMRLAARYISASEEARIGGDFYDAVHTAWGVRIVVGDVRGKGLDAVRLAAGLVGEFRSRAVSEPDLCTVVAAVDAAGSRMCDQAGEDFATAVFVQIEGELATIVRCGHPLPLLSLEDGVEAIGVSASLPLCLGTEGMSEHVSIGSGARMLLYSDGVVEARDAGGDWFDLEGSFARHASRLEPASVVDAILGDLERHCDGKIGDDVVLVIVEQPVVARTLAEPGVQRR